MSFFAGSHPVARADRHGEAAEDSQQDSHLHGPRLPSHRKFLWFSSTFSCIPTTTSPFFSSGYHTHTNPYTCAHTHTHSNFRGLCTTTSLTPSGPLQLQFHSKAIIKGKVYLGRMLSPNLNLRSGFDLLISSSSQLFVCLFVWALAY